MFTHACDRDDRLILLTISTGTVYLPLTKRPPSPGLSLHRAAYRVHEPTTWERLPSNCYRQVSTETTIKIRGHQGRRFELSGAVSWRRFDAGNRALSSIPGMIKNGT